MNTSRRKFVSTLFLSTVGLPFLSRLYGTEFLVNNLSPSIDPTEISKKLKEAADSRKNDNWNLAERIYQEIISVRPDEIRAYDGLKKIIQHNFPNDLQKILEMYLSGLNKNPQNALFNQRVATCYASIAQGNKKVAQKLGGTSQLLQKALNHSKKAGELSTKNIPIALQYKKLQKRKQFRADSTDARDNKEFRQYRKENGKQFRKLFTGRDKTKLEANLERLKQRENARRNLLTSVSGKELTSKRSKQISKLYVASIKSLRKNQNIPQAIKKSKELYQFTQGSGNALFMVKKLCWQYNKPEESEAILRANHQKQNTFWSGIALFDVLVARYKNKQIADLNEARNILSEASQKTADPVQNFELRSRQLILNIHTQDTNTYNNLVKLADSLAGTSSTHTIDRFNSLCVLYFSQLKQKENALRVIDIALKNDSQKTESGSVFEKIKIANRDRDDSKSIHRERLLQVRNKITGAV